MSKITSKLQVTIPKAIADRYGLNPGDEVEWQPADGAIRMVPAGRKKPLSVEERLRLFDQTTAMLRKLKTHSGPEPRERGWTREDLYDRGRPR